MSNNSDNPLLYTNLFENQLHLFREVTPAILKCTCQIFIRKNGELEPHATGVFIRFEDHYFLFSAGHVFDNRNERLWVTGREDEFVQLGGTIVQNEVKNRADDKIDVAIMLLNKETIALLGNSYRPISNEDLGIYHEVKQLPYYLAVGYPKTMTSYDRKREAIRIRSFEYMTMATKEEVYAPLNCNIHENIIFHYDKKNVYNYTAKKYLVGPDTFGISGAGVWYVFMRPGINGINPTKKLVGILTEWPIKNRKFWISTRIDIFTEMIRTDYNLKIPPSQILKVNF